MLNKRLSKYSSRKFVSGFTLVELLVSLVLSSLVVLMLSGGIGFSKTVMDKLGVTTQLNTQRFKLQGALSLLIAHARQNTNIETDSKLWFKGDKNRMSFVTLLVNENKEEMYLVNIELRGTSWVVERSRYFNHLSVSKNIETEQLNLLESAGIQYLHPSEDGVQWKASWDLEGQLPLAVKIIFSDYEYSIRLKQAMKF